MTAILVSQTLNKWQILYEVLLSSSVSLGLIELEIIHHEQLSAESSASYGLKWNTSRLSFLFPNTWSMSRNFNISSKIKGYIFVYIMTKMNFSPPFNNMVIWMSDLQEINTAFCHLFRRTLTPFIQVHKEKKWITLVQTNYQIFCKHF